MYAAYSLLLLAALVLSAPWWLWQMLRHGKYRAGWSERLGRVPDRLFEHGSVNTIWVHAVSVGEVLAVTQLVSELKAQLPDWRMVVSTTTDTGQKLARERFGRHDVFYAPLDLPWAVEAYFKALRPKLLVLAESEFWPNLLQRAHASGAAVAVVNARVSDRSLPRYQRFRRLLSRVLANVDMFLAQTEEDARRLVAIGAAAGRIGVGGNLKFEVRPPAETAAVALLKAAIAQQQLGPVIVAGSTLEGEEAMLLAMLRAGRERYSDALLLLAPRHPERFESVAVLLAQSGVPFTRRSQWSGAIPLPRGVFLLDSIGELAGLYEVADLALVGGSLVPRGGHNILEPAYYGVPIIVGPHTENFRDIIEIFRRAKAVRVVSPDALTPAVLALLENPAEREKLGRNARAVLETQMGATHRTMQALSGLVLQPTAGGSVPELATEHRR